MATEKLQNDIQEARDQFSLDFADNERLNAVSANLGLQRPIIGFPDNLWRAVVKALALQFKQIASKFDDVFALVFGPRITQATNLAAAAAIGDAAVTLNQTDILPQIGTLVLDEGQATEESVEYCFIDKTTNEVFLLEDLAFNHVVVTDAAASVLALDSTSIIVDSTAQFPLTGFPLVAVIGIGTPEEETVEIASIDVSTRTVTLSSPVVNTHTPVLSTVIQTSLLEEYAPTSYFINVVDADLFPAAGVLSVGPSAAFTASAGTVSSVTVGSSLFTNDKQVGNVVIFEGNTTAAIAGLSSRVLINDDTTLTFIDPLPAAPVASDLFTIRAEVSYTRADYTNDVFIFRELIADLTLPLGTRVELLDNRTSLILAAAQVKGTGWDIIQTEPREVDIFVPEFLEDLRDLRSSSYIHPAALAVAPATTTTAAFDTSSTSVDTVSLEGFPKVGLVTVDAGGGAEETLNYYIADIPTDCAARNELLGTVSVKMFDSSDFPVVFPYDVRIAEGTAREQLVTISANTLATNTLTISAPTGEAINIGDIVVFIPTTLLFSSSPTLAHLISESIDLHQDVHPTTLLLDGNLWLVDDTWPGPYIYDPAQFAPTEINTDVTALVSGPIQVSIDQVPSRTALEVEDASAFPLLGFPIEAIVGRGTGNDETVLILDVNLKQRARTTLSASIIAGVTFIPVVDLTPGPGAAADAKDFPDATGYRALIGGAAPEVVTVFGTTTSPSDGLLVSPILLPHTIGEAVTLMSDVLTVDPLGSTHGGLTAISDITKLIPLKRSPQAELVEILYNNIDVTSSAAFPNADNNIYLNFGPQAVKVIGVLIDPAPAGDIELPFADSSIFPITGTFTVIVSPGTFIEEVVRIDNNDTVSDKLDLEGGFGLINSHPISAKVHFIPGPTEFIDYDTTSTGSLDFASAKSFSNTHQPTGPITLSKVRSDPDNLGFDFPLRMPPSLLFRLEILLDWIRAAGVKVNLINKR